MLDVNQFLETMNKVLFKQVQNLIVDNFDWQYEILKKIKEWYVQR
jgi:hypothetical protein